MAIIAMRRKELMRSVNIAELKNQLSKYLTFAKGGEEIVIRDRNLSVAKLVPFSAEEASAEELLLVASGKMRLPQNPLNVDRLLKIRTGKVSGNEAVQSLLDDRAENL
jgi:antitoxin (DNA-binding transcriptional repressor) of toxin-antitoxin stability system